MLIFIYLYYYCIVTYKFSLNKIFSFLQKKKELSNEIMNEIIIEFKRLFLNIKFFT